MRGMNIIHDRVHDRIGFSVPSPDCYGNDLIKKLSTSNKLWDNKWI